MKNMVNWFTIPSSDFQRAKKFYGTIFDINMTDFKSPAGYDNAFFLNPEEQGVGGAVCYDPAHQPGKNGPLIYLNAEGILDTVLERVQPAGGEITLPRTSIGEWGFIATITDTEGNTVGLHSNI